MDGWAIALVIGGACIVGLIMRRLYFDPVDQENEKGVKRCLGEQARKRNGAIKAFSRMPVLTIPYKGVSIEVSVNESSDDAAREYTYATFRDDMFTDKKFGIYYWKEFILRPAVVIGSRLEFLDERLGGTYVVSGNDASFIKAVLTPEILDKLIEFKGSRLRVQFGRPHNSSLLSRERGWLTVFAWGIGTVDQPYDRVIEMAMLFQERLEALARQWRAA